MSEGPPISAQELVTLGSLFVGNMGSVELSQVAIRLRKPALLRAELSQPLDAQLYAELSNALTEVRRG